MMMNVYGKAKLTSEFCPKCGYEAFVIAGKFSCCDRPVSPKDPDGWRVHINIKNRERVPSEIQRAILESQDNKCLYCQNEFGSSVLREKELVHLNVCWDHKCPFSLSTDNSYPNIAAACQICNSIKGSKVHVTLEETRRHIKARRKALGYEK